MAEPAALFDPAPYTTAATPPAEALSPDRRRTVRQADAVARGVHPLALVFGPAIRIHPDADPGRTATRGNATARPLRCGTCRWRELVAHHNRAWPKCLYGWDGDQRTEPPRYSAGAATDVRSWWPACTDWERPP